MKLKPIAFIHEFKRSSGWIGKTLHWNAFSPHGDEMEVTPLYKLDKNERELIEDYREQQRSKK